MFTYGLVFKYKNKIWLVPYNEEGDVEEGDVISDHEGIYDTLLPNVLSFVSVEVEDSRVSIRDLRWVTIEHPDYSKEESLSKLLQEGGFPEFAKSVWNEWN